MNELAGKHILLGLSGGVACYKSAELARLLAKAGATVQVVMTEAAERFITPVTMQALTGRTVYTSQWDAREPNNMPHINLGREADAILVAPCSADFIARLVQGRSDELLSLLCLARPAQRVPLLLAPAMNREMWAHPATQRNLAQVAADGAVVLGVGTGEQACGETGDGRMLEPAELLEELTAFFAPKLLAGQRVLVTAGPTFEAIDPVRGITNLSSGKMGFAIARAAREAGAEVDLVAGPVHQPTPRGVEVWGTNTDLDGFAADRFEGGARVRLVCPDLRLAAGSYFLDVAVHARDGAPYDYRRKLVSLTVTARERGVGVYFPEHRWEFDGGARFAARQEP